MRLIDADAYQFPGDLVNEPTIDAVPVVRCIECKFLGFKDFSGICRGMKVYGIVSPNDYCSWGERKEDEQ